MQYRATAVTNKGAGLLWDGELDRADQYLRSAVTLLQAKAPDDLDDYRILVMDVAESVAAAAKGGEQAEAAEVEKIRQAVGGRPD